MNSEATFMCHNIRAWFGRPQLIARALLATLHSNHSRRLALSAAIAMFQWISLFLPRSYSQEQAPPLLELPAAKYAIGYRVLQVPATDARGITFTMDVAVWYP